LKLKRKPFPILEFDPSPKSFVNPKADYHYNGRAFHERVVLCFFQDVIEKLVKNHRAKKIAVFRSEFGENPAYEIKVKNKFVSVMHPGVGSALAAGFMEEAISIGGKKIIACGGAGALRKDLTLGRLIVPTAAVRDEGASYHYLPPARETKPHPKALAAIRKTLTKHGYSFATGKTWTTDGLFRETPGKIELRRREGCISVEMECAALFAVAKFRKIQFGQILYSGDDLSGETHQDRGWLRQASIREKIFLLAAEACAIL
jgi:uridine phosphorylase